MLGESADHSGGPCFLSSQSSSVDCAHRGGARATISRYLWPCPSELLIVPFSMGAAPRRIPHIEPQPKLAAVGSSLSSSSCSARLDRCPAVCGRLASSGPRRRGRHARIPLQVGASEASRSLSPAASHSTPRAPGGEASEIGSHGEYSGP